MRHIQKLTGLLNLGFRASTLVFRFLLSFYIIKYLGYEATGVFGLTVGAIGILPAMLGWGLNYFISREVVGQQKQFALIRVKSRLFVTTISLLVATLICVLVVFATGFQFSHLYLLIVALIWLETYGLDIHMPLVAQEMALEANVLAFIRSALWVPFAIGLGIAVPSMRSLDMVFVFWIGSYVVALAALLFFLRKWPLRDALSKPIQFDWIKERLRHSWYIYVSDLSIVGLIYADRYIVTYFLGLTLTGIYTFFFSLTNALQTLMQTAVVQLALPQLFKAFNSGSMTKWHSVMRQQVIKTAVLAIGMGAGLYLASEILIHFMDMKQLAEHRVLFLLLLLAAVVRSCSDLLSIGLTSMKKDNHYATINLIGVCLAIAMAVIMIAAFGFIGTGIGALVTAVVIALIRVSFLVNFLKGDAFSVPSTETP